MSQPKKHPAALKTSFTITLLAATLPVTACSKSSNSKPVDDATLTSRVKSALSADSAINQQQVQYAVRQGVVTLYGNVSNDTVSTAAAQDVSKVAGVKEVIDNLTVAGVATAPTITTPGAQPRPATAEELAAIGQNQPPSAAAANTAQSPPAYRDVNVPAGTAIPIRITQTLDSAVTQTGTAFTGVVAHQVVTHGLVVIPVGSAVSGHVVLAKDATHFKGSSELSLKLNAVRIHGNLVTIATAPYTVEGHPRGTNTAEKVGGGAVIGAVLGGILGGGRGAAIGAGAGAGGGAVVQASTRGQQVRIPSESLVRFRIAAPFSVQTAEVPSPAQNPNGQAPALQQR